MIRQSAFTGSAPLLKGGLHCHTTRSDGKGSPEEVIRLHKQNGYDFLALTDHRVYNYKNFAPDADIVIVPGMEMDRNIEGFAGVHCFHTVCLGTKDSTYAQEQTFPAGRVSGQEEFQKVLDDLHAAGQMTIYCHPEWSNTPAREFDQLRGNFAMEIWNTGCALENAWTTNRPPTWTELAHAGQEDLRRRHGRRAPHVPPLQGLGARECGAERRGDPRGPGRGRVLFLLRAGDP